MERPKRLTQAFCKGVKQPGRYGDGRGGNGLALVVRLLADRSLGKVWVQQLWRRDRSTVNLGLGTLETVTLAEARATAAANAARMRAGEDVREPRGLPLAKRIPTVRAAADGWFDLQRPKWKGDRNEHELRQRLEKHAASLLGLRVDVPTRQAVMDAMLKVEQAPTRRRLLENLRSIFDYAILNEWRTDNPADRAVRAALAGKPQQPKHHAALPVADLAAALAEVEAKTAWPLTAFAVRFVALTCTRSGEVRGARWDEIDRDARTWTIPTARMKSDRPFLVPLSGAALAVLDRAAAHSDGGQLVFPGAKSGRVMDSHRLRDAFKGTAATVHGMRSTFRTWAAEAGVQREVAEMCLAHALGSATELAYQRSDFFVARTAVMERWASVVEGREEHGKVVELDSRRA